MEGLLAPQRWGPVVLETAKTTLFPSLSLGAVKGAHILRQISLL